MKRVANVILASGLAAALFASGCNYAKPVMYLNIANHSGHSMENLEVKHPTGIFGLPELRNEQIHRHMVPVGTPCKFTLTFEDQTGKKYIDEYDPGAKCPTEIALEVGVGMTVSGRVVRP